MKTALFTGGKRTAGAEIILVDDSVTADHVLGEDIARQLDAIAPDAEIVAGPVLPFAPASKSDLPLLEERSAAELVVYASVPATAKVQYAGQRPFSMTYTKTLVVSPQDNKAFFLAGPSSRDRQSGKCLEDLVLGFAQSVKPRPEDPEPISLDHHSFQLEDSAHYALREGVCVLHGAKGDRILMKTLLEGGYGSLRVVYNPHEARIEVVKTIRKTGDAYLDKAFLTALLNEQRMLELFADERTIIRSYGLETIDGELALVEPYVGLNSYQLIDETREQFLAGDRTAMNRLFYRMSEEVLEMLHALHRKGVADYDLKPDNLLWERDAAGVPCVRKIDFGTALTYVESRATHLFRFTPQTVEPQLLIPWLGGTFLAAGHERAARLDYEDGSDMYSFGATMLTMMEYALGLPPDERQLARINFNHKGDMKRLVHPSFVFEHHATLMRTLERTKAENRKYSMFDDQAFEFVALLLKPRVERPESDELVIGGDDGDYCYGTTPAEETTVVKDVFEFVPFNAERSLNYAIAHAIAEGMRKIQDAAERKIVHGKIAYVPESGMSPSIIFVDEMNIRATKRFSDFKYLDPVFAEPEQYLTWEFPALAPPEQREYWKKEQRLDIEAEAKVYELGRAVLAYMAERLDAQLQDITPEAFEARIDGLLDHLRAESLDHLVTEQTSGCVSVLYAVHERDYDLVRGVNALRPLFDESLFLLVKEMFAHRRDRKSAAYFMEKAQRLVEDYSGKEA